MGILWERHLANLEKHKCLDDEKLASMSGVQLSQHHITPIYIIVSVHVENMFCALAGAISVQLVTITSRILAHSLRHTKRLVTK